MTANNFLNHIGSKNIWRIWVDRPHNQSVKPSTTKDCHIIDCRREGESRRMKYGGDGGSQIGAWRTLEQSRLSVDSPTMTWFGSRWTQDPWRRLVVSSGESMTNSIPTILSQSHYLSALPWQRQIWICVNHRWKTGYERDSRRGKRDDGGEDPVRYYRRWWWKTRGEKRVYESEGFSWLRSSWFLLFFSFLWSFNVERVRKTKKE